MQNVVHLGRVEINRVLRNAFALLALTLIPTILGVYLGVQLGLPEMMQGSPWMSLGIFLVVTIALLMGIHATATTAVAIPILMVFTGVMGANLSGLISIVLGMSTGIEIVALAALGTVGVMLGCSVYAMTTSRDFSSMGGFLMGALIGIIVLGVANVFFQVGIISTLLAAASLLLFSAFTVYDVQRIVNGGETNYILATTSLYLNMLNIFSSLLQLLASLWGSDD